MRSLADKHLAGVPVNNDHDCYAGVCADPQECNAQIDEAASYTGTSTVVGVCVTPKPTGSSCAAGYGTILTQ